MNTAQLLVREFMHKFGQQIVDMPTIIADSQTRDLRASLITEEAAEFKEATDTQSLVGIADAIADLLYVVYGAANAYGIDAQVVFEEVHRSNMTKVWEDGTVRRREDGKVMKPSTYSPADVAGVLRRLGVGYDG